MKKNLKILKYNIGDIVLVKQFKGNGIVSNNCTEKFCIICKIGPFNRDDTRKLEDFYFSGSSTEISDYFVKILHNETYDRGGRLTSQEAIIGKFKGQEFTFEEITNLIDLLRSQNTDYYEFAYDIMKSNLI